MISKSRELPNVNPMLASSGEQPFNSPDFIYELKWDGYRCLAYRGMEQSWLVSRNGRDFSKRFPEVLPDIGKLPSGVILDGEMVVLDKQGKADFSQLQHKRSEQVATFVVFDLLYWRYDNLCSLPLEMRRQKLQEHIFTKQEGDRLMFSRSIEEKGIEFYKLAISQGLEGIMAKRKNSLYFPGLRTNDWLKLKERRQLYALISGYLPGKRGFKSLYLAQYDQDKLVYIGNVGTGFSQGQIDQLLQGFNQIKQTDCPFARLPEEVPPGVWLKPILVAGIDYLEFTANGRLRQPSFVTLRSDKEAKDCIYERSDGFDN